MASENRANLDVSNGSAERKSATPPPKSETGIPASPPSPLPLPWGALRVEPVAVIVFAPPGQCFQVRSGNRYVAGEDDGAIPVSSEADLEDLLRSGCRAGLAS